MTHPKRPGDDPNQLTKLVPRLGKWPSCKTSRWCVASRARAQTVASMENITNMPAKRALAVLDEPAPAAVPGPPKRVSKKVRAAIDAMVSGDCKKIKEAAEKVGLARESLSRALSTPHVAEHLRQKVIRHLSIAAARAGATKVELLDSASELVRDRASTFVLGLADIAPATAPSVSLNIEMKAGHVIDLSDDPPPMRTISP